MAELLTAEDVAKEIINEGVVWSVRQQGMDGKAARVELAEVRARCAEMIEQFARAAYPKTSPPVVRDRADARPLSSPSRPRPCPGGDGGSCIRGR